MEGKSMTGDKMDGFVEKIKQLVENAPSRLDRAFRAYAITAALEADKDGTEFKRLTKLLMEKDAEDRAVRGVDCLVVEIIGGRPDTI